jgi:hypothetical protein
VHFLISGVEPAPDTLRALRELSGRRPVVVYRGGFERMESGGAPAIYPPRESALTPRLDAILDEVVALPADKARRAFCALSYEYSIGVRDYARHRELLRVWRKSGFVAEKERSDYRLSVAEDAQARGRPARAVLLNLAEYRVGRNPYLLSEAGDALERVGRGLIPMVGSCALLLHQASSRRFISSKREVPAWVLARTARVFVKRGRSAQAVAILTGVLARGEGQDLWVRAHCHRLRAIGLALETLDWRADAEEARRLFEFAGRTLEVGSTWRSAAMCEVIEGRIDWRVRSESCLEKATDAYERAADHSSGLRLRVQKVITRAFPRRVAAFLLVRL